MSLISQDKLTIISADKPLTEKEGDELDMILKKWSALRSALRTPLPEQLGQLQTQIATMPERNRAYVYALKKTLKQIKPPTWRAVRFEKSKDIRLLDLKSWGREVIRFATYLELRYINPVVLKTKDEGVAVFDVAWFLMNENEDDIEIKTSCHLKGKTQTRPSNIRQTLERSTQGYISGTKPKMPSLWDSVSLLRGKLQDLRSSASSLHQLPGAKSTLEEIVYASLEKAVKYSGLVAGDGTSRKVRINWREEDLSTDSKRYLS